MAKAVARATVTSDHDEIRRWAEERNARPACVRGTGSEGDIGMLRLDFPGYSGEDSLEEISWDDWFQKFDERGLALLHQETTARGQQSNFNKLISRETPTATSNEENDRSSDRESSRSGSRSSRRTASATGSRSRRSGSRTSSQRGRSSKKTSSSRSGSSRSSSGKAQRKSRTSAKKSVASERVHRSTRANRTESVRGRTHSRRKAA